MTTATETTAAPLTREQWLNAFVTASRPAFERIGKPLPEAIRVSIGFPSGGKRGKAIGECWSSGASRDGHFEIFIHPGQEESARIADILTHELAHAAAGLEAKHGRGFAKVAKALGLEGKMTATTAGPEWHEWAGPILDEIGPIPHAKLSGSSSAKPKQTTRMIKCECDQCGFTFRTTKKWLESAAEAAEFAADDDGEEEGEDAPALLRCPLPSCEGSIEASGGGTEGEAD